MKIRHIITLINGSEETADYETVQESQEGFCKEFQRDDVKDVKLKFVLEEK